MNRKIRAICVSSFLVGLQIHWTGESGAADNAPSSFDASKYSARPSPSPQVQRAPTAVPPPVAAPAVAPEETLANSADQGGSQLEPPATLEAAISGGDQERTPR